MIPRRPPSADPASPARPPQLLRAGSRGWELWRLDDGEPTPLPRPEDETGDGLSGIDGRAALAVPLRQCLSLRLDLPAGDGTEPQEALPLELEARGLVPPGEDAHGSLQALAAPRSEGEETLQRHRVTLLAEDALELARELNAPVALPAERLLPLPDDGLVLWREFTRPVCAVCQGGRAVHAQALGGSQWNHAAARELRAMLRALQAEGVLVPDPLPVRAWDDEPLPPAFAEALGLEVDARGPLPAPHWPAALPPAEVPSLPHLAEARESGRRQRRLRLLALGLAAAVLLWLGFGLGDWAVLDLRRSRLEARLDELGPSATLLAETDAEWREAIDPLLYEEQPLELMRAVRDLQPAGLRLQRFAASPESLELRGEADTSSLALDFQQQLETSSVFSDWTWENRSPTLDAGGRAEFRFNATR